MLSLYMKYRWRNKLLFITFTHFPHHGKKFWAKKRRICYVHLDVNNSGLGIRSSNFGANRSFFAKKVSKWAICSKSEWFAHLLIFWLETWAICSRSLIPSERPEQIACGRSFVLSNLSDSLTSLRRNEQIFCFLKNTVKNVQKIWLKKFFFLANRLFFVSER